MRKTYTKPGLTRVNLVPDVLTTYTIGCKTAAIVGPGGWFGTCIGGAFVNCKLGGS
jgi:hypothetical protein